MGKLSGQRDRGGARGGGNRWSGRSCENITGFSPQPSRRPDSFPFLVPLTAQRQSSGSAFGPVVSQHDSDHHIYFCYRIAKINLEYDASCRLGAKYVRQDEMEMFNKKGDLIGQKKKKI